VDAELIQAAHVVGHPLQKLRRSGVDARRLRLRRHRQRDGKRAECKKRCSQVVLDAFIVVSESGL
jgi:hypothetical protein